MKPRLRLASFLLLASLASGVLAQMPRVELSVGIHRISAEVADTEATRQQGLMHRQSLAPQEGMVFVFAQPDKVCMWMRNTFLPLSVAFFDETGRISNIADMTPHDETPHCAARPGRYALEMNRGWFARRGITAGGVIRGVDKLPPPR